MNKDSWKEIARLQRMENMGMFPIFKVTQYSGGYHEYSYDLIGKHGAVSFNLSFADDEYEPFYSETEGRRGGVEYHYRQGCGYMKDYEPSHDNCHVLESECWHDGTSLWAEQHWIPRWLMYNEQSSQERDAMIKSMLIDAYKNIIIPYYKDIY